MTRKHEPLSAWSGLAFALVAIHLVAVQYSAATIIFGLALMMLGGATALFHYGELHRWEQDLDHAFMNCALGALAVHAIGGGLPFVIAAIALGLVAEYGFDHPNRGLMVAFVFFSLVGTIQTAPIMAWAALSCFVVALGFWTIEDEARIGPVLLTADAAHGAWHVGAAIGIDLFYLAAL